MLVIRQARFLAITLATSALGVYLLALAITKAFDSIPSGDADPGLVVGDWAPDFTLRDIDGKEYRVADHLGKRSLVLEFGSFSCPMCAGQLGMMREVAEKHKATANFVFIYCSEAHPQEAPPITSWKERRKRACGLREVLGSSMVILVDDFDNRSVQKRYGALANSGYVIDQEGRIVWKMDSVQSYLLDKWLQSPSLTVGR